MDLSERSDDDLLLDVTTLVGSHLELTSKLVAHLAEIEERRLHLVKGFSSMFEFCLKGLGFSEGEAFRRIAAARLGRRFPVVYSLLASGRVNLSTLELCREWLTEGNHEELLAAVAGKTKREVRVLMAARFPQPDRPTRIRRAGIEPLSEARYSVEFTASETLREKLELCRDLMSHANPSRDIGVVIECAVDLLLAALERKRLAKMQRPPRASKNERLQSASRDGYPQPCGPSDVHATPARIANAVRREVYERDGLQCFYNALTSPKTAAAAKRGHSSSSITLSRRPWEARTKPTISEFAAEHCRAHNQLWAEQALGRERVERGRHLRQQRQQKSTAVRAESMMSRAVLSSAGEQDSRAATTFEKVRAALRNMGFREHQTRAAIAEVVKMHGAGETLPLEKALREALLVATAA